MYRATTTNVKNRAFGLSYCHVCIVTPHHSQNVRDGLKNALKRNVYTISVALNAVSVKNNGLFGAFVDVVGKCLLYCRCSNG